MVQRSSRVIAAWLLHHWAHCIMVLLDLVLCSFVFDRKTMLVAPSLWNTDAEGSQQSATISGFVGFVFGFGSLFLFPLGSSFPIHPLLVGVNVR